MTFARATSTAICAGCLVACASNVSLARLLGNEVSSYVAPRSAVFRGCQEKLDPAFVGDTWFSFTMDPQGNVSDVVQNGGSIRTGPLIDCVVREVRAWKFPVRLDRGATADLTLAFKREDVTTWLSVRAK